MKKCAAMHRSWRKKSNQYVLDRFYDEDPEGYFKYKSRSSRGLTHEQMEFLEALSHGDVNQVKTFLDHGLDPNFTILPTRQTPLHTAVLFHSPKNSATEQIMRSLLFFGSDPNAQDPSGNTPLHSACQTADFVSVELLVNAGADINVINLKGQTPLMCICSVSNPCPKIAELLLQSGAKMDVMNKDQQNVVHLLCSSSLCPPSDWDSRSKVAEVLLRMGFPASDVDARGKTPLCYEFLRFVYVFCAYESLEDDKNFSKVAETLVAGGALHDLEANKADLKMLIGITFMHQEMSPYVHSFFLTCRSCIAFKDYKTICKWLSRPGEAYMTNRPVLPENQRRERRRPRYRIHPIRREEEEPVVHTVDVSYNDILWVSPPSLLNLAKMVIRSSLGGHVLQKASLLDLPSALQTFIKSLD